MRALISRILQRSFIALNPVTRFILAGRLHALASRNLILLNFRGRISGRSFTTPVSYVRIDDDLYVPGGGKWWKNLEVAPVRVRLRGIWFSVTPEVIREPTRLSVTLARMIAKQRLVALFTALRVGPDGLPTQSSLERERTKQGLVAVRLHLESPAGVGEKFVA